ncbi:MAG: hypothetical protein NY202_00440 [Mollicutes bacterium UO1]
MAELLRKQSNNTSQPGDETALIIGGGLIVVFFVGLVFILVRRKKKLPKTNLIKKENNGVRLGKKIARQVKLYNSIYEKELKKIILDREEKNTNTKKRTRIKIDWESLEKKSLR